MCRVGILILEPWLGPGGSRTGDCVRASARNIAGSWSEHLIRNSSICKWRMLENTGRACREILSRSCYMLKKCRCR